jgi:hypothetical protein
MRLSLVLSIFCFGLALPSLAQVPQMFSVQPDNGKVGSVLRIQGRFLDKAKVEEVYLTDHTFDMKVKVLDQTEDSIEIRIPPSAKPGRLQLLVKTAEKQPKLLEQPLYISVEEKKDDGEVAATH